MSFQYKQIGRFTLLVTLLVIVLGLSTQYRIANSDAAVFQTHLPISYGQPSAGPQNVIMLIGDGMGYEQIRAAGIFKNGNGGTLNFEQMPYVARMSVYASDNYVTDSAASTTAVATGYKVKNGTISINAPGDGAPIETALEFYRNRCRTTGLVTSTFVTHATPAAFASHVPDRYQNSAISRQMLGEVRPNVIFGGGDAFMTPEFIASYGYVRVTNRSEMLGLTPAHTHAIGQFGIGNMAWEYDYAINPSDTSFDTLPHLSEMTASALSLLENENGFFLMVEGGRIDHASHSNEIERTIYEMLEFERAVQVVLDWVSARRSNTLVIVTADHETGGLAITANNGQGNFPTVTWLHRRHTDSRVAVFGQGPNAENIHGLVDNTYLYNLLTAGNETLPQNCRP